MKKKKRKLLTKYNGTKNCDTRKIVVKSVFTRKYEQEESGCSTWAHVTLLLFIISL